MAQELEVLRQQTTGSRQENIGGFGPGVPPPLTHTSYQSSVGPYPPPIMHPHQPNHSGHSDSRPNSNQNMFPPLQNGHPSRNEGPPT
jgi:hypothetical protein